MRVGYQFDHIEYQRLLSRFFVKKLSPKVPVLSMTQSQTGSAISIARYREITKDWKAPDQLVLKRLQYLTELCRHTIQKEMKRYEENRKNS